MPFQAYLDTIEKRARTTPDQLRRPAEAKDSATANRIEAGQIVVWLKSGFGFGHRHPMAILAPLEGKPGVAA